jgi:hypothetical protein
MEVYGISHSIVFAAFMLSDMKLAGRKTRNMPPARISFEKSRFSVSIILFLWYAVANDCRMLVGSGARK